MGFCSGIENYSRHIANRPPCSRPSTVIDFFPKDYLLIVDECTPRCRQISGMYFGDRSRKSPGRATAFRLPSVARQSPAELRGVSIDAGTDALRERDAGRARDGVDRAKGVAAGLLPAVEPGFSAGGQYMDIRGVNLLRLSGRQDAALHGGQDACRHNRHRGTHRSPDRPHRSKITVKPLRDKSTICSRGPQTHRT